MDELVTKSVGSWTIKDEARGEVEAEIGTVNEVDRDLDVFLPGSVPVGAKVKMSAYDHDVVKRGAPPAGIATVHESNGKIILKGRFFLSTERGREAFATVKELGPDGEWSIAFPNSTAKVAPMTAEWNAKGAKRLLAGVEPMEASPVWRGAQFRTRTLSAKSADSIPAGMETVLDALQARNSMFEDVSQHWTAKEVLDGHLIVAKGSTLLRVSYELKDDNTTAWGEPEEVEVVYQSTKKTDPEPVVTKTEPETPKPAPIDPSAFEQGVLASVFQNMNALGGYATASQVREQAANEARRLSKEIAAKREAEEMVNKQANELFEQMQRTARRLAS